MTLKEGRSLRSDHFHVYKAVRCRLLRRRLQREENVRVRCACVRVPVYACVGDGREYSSECDGDGTRAANYHTGCPLPNGRLRGSPRVYTYKCGLAPKARGSAGVEGTGARPCPFNVCAEITFSLARYFILNYDHYTIAAVCLILRFANVTL